VVDHQLPPWASECPRRRRVEGLDSTEVGLEAYPEFGKSSQFA
jgi:hypothetical protein